MKFNIGDLVCIKPNTKFWCINIQKSITLDQEVIGEISNTIYNDGYYFVKSKILFGGFLPFLVDDNAMGEIGCISSILEKWEIPPPMILEAVYKK